MAKKNQMHIIIFILILGHCIVAWLHGHVDKQDLIRSLVVRHFYRRGTAGQVGTLVEG